MNDRLVLLQWVACAFLFMNLLMACQSLPKERLRQATIPLQYELGPDSLRMELGNPLWCPLRMDASCEDKEVQLALDSLFPFVLDAKSDTVLRHGLGTLADTTARIVFSCLYGVPREKMDFPTLVLPFLSERPYAVIQGYNGTFSHDSDYARYALDFGLNVGDTVCAAANGYVVGVIEGYKHGGNDRKWRDYANFITLFHPEGNFFTQYVHLKHEGGLVAVGDSVVAGQPIGLSGKTGFTSVAHLHFNVLEPNEEGMASMPARFEEGYEGAKLKRGMVVEK